MRNPAIVSTAPGKTEVQHVEMPPPGPGEVCVRTDVSSISIGTEGWILQNKFSWSPTPYPNVGGYQRVGRVSAVGPGVTEFAVGQRVMGVGGEWAGPVEAMWGAHILDANLNVGRVFAVPDTVSDEDAASLVVAQVGWNAANRPTYGAGDWVVVFGDGVIGQSGAQAARARGAKVALVGHRPERLAIAAKHSADATINSHDGGVAELVKAHTRGTVRTVIDTVQTEAAQLQYLDLLEPKVGQVVYSGFTPGKAWADMGLLQQRELTAHFVAGWTRPRMEATLELMRVGKMTHKPLVTHRFDYREGPRAFELVLSKREPFLGITIDWRGAHS